MEFEISTMLTRDGVGVMPIDGMVFIDETSTPDGTKLVPTRIYLDGVKVRGNSRRLKKHRVLLDESDPLYESILDAMVRAVDGELAGEVKRAWDRSQRRLGGNGARAVA